MITFTQPKRLLLPAILLAISSLTACGGDPDIAGLSLSGTAATGAAMANAAVTVVCNSISGTGSVTGTGTTDSNGNYTVVATDGKPACLVTASKTTNGVTTTLNSIATVEGVVNINPITNLIVAGLVVGKGAASVTQLITPTYAPTVADVATAQTAVITQINIALVAQGKTPIVVGTNLLGGGFTVGSAADTALDNLLAIKALSSTGLASVELQAAVVKAVDAAVPVNPGTPSGASGGG